MKKNYLWLLPFYRAVATYFYYENMRRTMRNAIVLYLLKLLTIFEKKFSSSSYVRQGWK